MAYIPTTFVRGQIISSAFLNSFQAALQSTAATVDASTSVTVYPPTDGVNGWADTIQAACDAVHAKGGGDVLIAPSTAYIADKTIFVHPDTNVIGSGTGVTLATVKANFPLASCISRVQTSPGVWEVGTFPCEQRAVFYILPEAPFDPLGMVLTTAGYQRVPELANLTILGNKNNQSAQVFGVYAPQGKSDPEWARVSGAYAAPGYPTGVIDLNADAQAYTAWYVHDFECYQLSGTGFYAGPDRQRAKIGNSTNCQQSGTYSGSSVVLDARGYEILGNDAVIAPGSGFGNNTSPVQGSGQSGHLVAGANLYPQKGPNAYVVFKNQDTNGASLSNSVLNGAAQSQTSTGGSNARKGIVLSGNDFNMSQVLVTSGQPSGTIPSVPDDAHNAYTYYSGYRQCVSAGNVFSVDVNSKSFKYHVSAVNASGVRHSGIASSEPNVQSYLTTPFYTDNTLGVIGYDYLDPYTATLHIGVSWKGLLAGANIASTQFVQMDSPLVVSQGIAGGPGGTAPQVGYLGERIVANGNLASLTNGAQTNIATLVCTAGEYSLNADIQIVITTNPTVATNLQIEFSVSETSATLDGSSSRLYGSQLIPIPAGINASGGIGICHISLADILKSPSANKTYYVVVRATGMSTNTLTATATIHGRRWLAGT
jgi:hypothetical protein